MIALSDNKLIIFQTLPVIQNGHKHHSIWLHFWFAQKWFFYKDSVKIFLRYVVNLFFGIFQMGLWYIANIFLGTCAYFSLRYLATRHRFEQQAVRNIDQSRTFPRIELHSITSQSFAHCQIIYSTRAPWVKMIPFVSEHFYELSILESCLVLFWWSPGRKEAQLVLFILHGQNRHNLYPCNTQMCVRLRL